MASRLARHEATVHSFVPAKIVVHVEHREKLGCTACRKDVSVAERAATPAVVRKVDTALLAKLVDEKCVLGLAAFQNQSAKFEQLAKLHW